MALYDQSKVTVVVDGTYITGFGEGTKVSAERNEDNIVPYVGADGTVTNAVSADETGTITIPLAISSPSISFLNGLANQKKPFSITVTDFNENGVNCSASQAYVSKPIFPEKGKEVTVAEFTILCDDLSIQ